MDNAYGQGTIVKIVLFLLLLSFTGIFLFKSNAFATDVIEDDCWRQVEAKAFSLIFFDEKENEASILCPTKYKTVEAGMTDEEIKDMIAEDTLSCWTDWGRGEKNLFKEEEGIFCHECYHYTFEDKGRRIANMENYLIDKTKNGESYLALLSPYRTEDITGIEEEVKRSLPATFPTVDTSKDWSLIFKYVKGKDKIIGELQKEDAIQGVGVGVGVMSAGIAAYSVGTAVAATESIGIIAVCNLFGGPIGCAVIAGGVASISGVVIYAYGEDELDVFAVTRPVVFDEEGLRNYGCEKFSVAQSTKGFK